MQQWSVTVGESETPGAEGWPVYGVAVVLPDGSGWQWTDVDTDPAVATLLADRLQREQPEPCHFTEMILDFIEEMASKV